MSFTTAITRLSYNGDGVSVNFPVPWLFYANTDLLVIVGGVTQGLGAQFNATGAGLGSGTVTFVTAPPVGAGNVQIILNDPLTQVANFVDGTAFPSATLNQVNDRAVQISSRLYDLITRSLRAPDGDASPNMLLPSAAQRSNGGLGGLIQGYDVNGNPSLLSVLPPGSAISAAIIGSFIGPASAAETATGVTVTAPWLQYGNVLRYGIKPNDPTAAVANTTIFTTLVNASIASGPTGLIYFPNAGSGAPDTYYFSSTAPAQLRDGITLDLNGCVLNFSGTFNAAMNTYGFLTAIRDVTIQNGTIVVNYNGTGGTNNGNGIRIGSRSGYPFGTYAAGIFDQDDLVANGKPLQGGVTIQNIRISSNNPATTTSAIILALGGLRNFVMKNVWIDGQNAVKGNGFYYEYGWSSTNGSPGTQNLWTSSHMTASSFTAITVSNLATGGISQGFGANGAYGCTFSDINVITADQGLGFGAGESFFFRTWALDGTTPRMLTLRDITVKQCTIGLVMGGAQPISGYLSAVLSALPFPQQYQACTDFLSYNLDGFSISAPSGTTIICSGSEVAIRNGTAKGGAIDVSQETGRFTLESSKILDSAGPNGLRHGFTPTIWSPVRPGFLSIKNSKICGSVGVGISLGATQGAIIENNQLGYNTLYDVAAETTQTNGVNIAATSFGVRCRNNFISTSGGAVAYQNINTTVDSGNSIEGERNLQTNGGGGGWLTDFQSASAQSIANGNTIVVLNIRAVRLTTAGAVTGVIMAAGYASGQTVYLVNESANSITFAASGTSRVAAGVSAVLAALTKMVLVWDSSTNLWY